MNSATAFKQIAALRAARGETLAQLALAAGISSKGRLSEMENGLVRPTVAQALTFERMGRECGIEINAAELNADVAAARAGVLADLRTHEASSSVDDDADDGRVILCSVCDLRVDGMVRNSCTFVDCPHVEALAA